MDSSCGRVSRLHHHYRVIGDAAGSRGINVRKSIILQVRVPPTKRDRQPNVTAYTANITRLPNVDLMLGQRRRRWPSIKSTLEEFLVFAGNASSTSKHNNVGLMLDRRRRRWTNINTTVFMFVSDH